MKNILQKISLSIFILILSFLIIAPKPVEAQNISARELLIQQIEILKHEISVLQSLILNSRQQGNINSPAYLAVDLSSGNILLEKNPNASYPIASITKLMNAVVSAENNDKNQSAILTETMLKPFGQSPSLFLGLRVTMQNLLKASLIQSTNDAAESLACLIGKEDFLKLMNQKARELKMENTIFYDAHGLSYKNASTASDLAKLLKYVYENHPEILSTTKENDFWLPDSSGRLLKFQNVNNFYPLSNFLGGKTGYLPESKQTIASVFTVNKKPTAIIVLYSNNRQADVFSILKKIE